MLNDTLTCKYISSTKIWSDRTFSLPECTCKGLQVFLLQKDSREFTILNKCIIHVSPSVAHSSAVWLPAHRWHPIILAKSPSTSATSSSCNKPLLLLTLLGVSVDVCVCFEGLVLSAEPFPPHRTAQPLAVNGQFNDVSDSDWNDRSWNI